MSQRRLPIVSPSEWVVLAAFALLLVAAAGAGSLISDRDIRRQSGGADAFISAGDVVWTDSRSPKQRRLYAEQLTDTRGAHFELKGLRLVDARGDVIEAHSGRVDPEAGTLELGGRARAKIRDSRVRADGIDVAMRTRTIRLYGRVLGLHNRMLFSADEALLSLARRGLVLEGDATMHFDHPPLLPEQIAQP
ncbi:MAG: hypothetical protein ISN29_02325 [Gammaproteobacteria bacterium AqS3]|nr:hypothetical protein [Gammaproteobacteria bacterium AqS3]